MAAKSKKKTGRKQTKKKKTEQSFLGEEIFVWVTLAVSILLLISNFGFGGNIGYHVSGALKHGFGIVAYFVPFLLFGIVSFLIANKENRIAYIKSALALVFMILTCTLLDLIHEMGDVTQSARWLSVTDLYRTRHHWVFLVQHGAMVLPRCFFDTPEAESVFIAHALTAMTDEARARSPDAAKVAALASGAPA